MTFFNFKPKFLPTLFTVPALVVLLSLSFWQFKRLVWKENLIEQVKIQSSLPAIDLPIEVEIEKLLYRKVKLKGSFLHEKELHLYGGSRQFKGKNGYFILTPMVTEANKIILINRGWVVENIKEASKRPETLVSGKVEIEGVVMKSEEKPLYVHDNQKDKNLWFFINLDEIREHTGLNIENFYILVKDNPNEVPRGKDLEPNLRNHHLAYAFTWLACAIILLIIYVRYHKITAEKN